MVVPFCPLLAPVRTGCFPARGVCSLHRLSCTCDYEGHPANGSLHTQISEPARIPGRVLRLAIGLASLNPDLYLLFALLLLYPLACTNGP